MTILASFCKFWPVFSIDHFDRKAKIYGNIFEQNVIYSSVKFASKVSAKVPKKDRMAPKTQITKIFANSLLIFVIYDENYPTIESGSNLNNKRLQFQHSMLEIYVSNVWIKT